MKIMYLFSQWKRHFYGRSISSRLFILFGGRELGLTKRLEIEPTTVRLVVLQQSIWFYNT